MTTLDPGGLRAALRDAIDAAPPSELRAAVTAVLARALGETNVTLVGGGAVEFYSQGAYQTADIDLIATRSAIGALLESGGFAREGRYWIDEDLELAIEVPGQAIGRSEETKRFETVAGPARIISVEDAIVDRLCAAKYWASSTDWEQAILVAGIQRTNLDLDRLRARSEEEGVDDLLDELLELVHRD